MHSSGNAWEIPEKEKPRKNSSASKISTKAKAFGDERNDSDIEQLSQSAVSILIGFKYISEDLL